jgi:hypothetical protein
VSARAPGSAANDSHSFALVGDITLNGPFTKPDSTLIIKVRVARYNAAVSEAATPVITLRAPVREWGQLPARTAWLCSMPVGATQRRRTPGAFA